MIGEKAAADLIKAGNTRQTFLTKSNVQNSAHSVI